MTSAVGEGRDHKGIRRDGGRKGGWNKGGAADHKLPHPGHQNMKKINK